MSSPFSQLPSSLQEAGESGSSDARAEMAALFAYDTVGEDRLQVAPFPTGLLRLYGGQITAQALGAAQRTVSPGRLAHSCHAYFAEPGDSLRAVDFMTERDRDGRSFSSRRVQVSQGDKLIMSFAASFQEAEPGGRSMQTMPPGIPDPESLPSLIDEVRASQDRLPARHRPFWLRESVLEWRPVQPWRFLDPPTDELSRDFWFRLRCPIGDDPAEHQRWLVYASDLHILHTAMGPLGEPVGSARYQTASLDHAVWFHDRFRADEWLLYRTYAGAASNARALGRGEIFTRGGRQVATIMQEGLARLLAEPRSERL